MKKNRILLLTISTLLATSSWGQASRLLKGVEYSVSASETGATGKIAPLWLSANHDGLSSTENNSGYLRGSINRPIEQDTTHNWKFGYGLDLASAYNHTSDIILQQLYAEAQYKKVRLSLGCKERDIEFINDDLSSGGMTYSRNARPIPQLRAELADWWNITGRAHFLSIKGHVAYGMLTDGDWQERFTNGETTGLSYVKQGYYHSKAGYFRFGDERRFPLTGMFGLQMVAEFGGEVWNLDDRGGTGNTDFQTHQVMGHGLSDFFHAFIPGGSDVTDGVYANASGNQLGSWIFSLDWNTPQWGVRAYMDHFFEDHSMMFFQYGWRDNLIGIEGRLPENRFLSHFVYEFLHATDQSGSIYHDASSVLPEQLSGRDAYYSHNIYGAYHHWGQVLGNPFIIGPIYNPSHEIYTYHNRVKAHHIGLSGHPTDEVKWRFLLSHERSLGTYDYFLEDNIANHFLGEVSYSPQQLKGWHFKLGLGGTTGPLLGTSYGMQATITKSGLIQRRRNK